MKPIRWTKADAKRAERIGWFIWRVELDGTIRAVYRNRFKSDAEAARWVVDESEWDYVGELSKQTCRKAVLICCGGAR